MGLNLTLLPLHEPQQLSYVSVLCYDRLSFDQDPEIFHQLIAYGGGTTPTIKVNPIPPQMWVQTYEDGGLLRRRDDVYGTDLTFVYAQQMKQLKVADDASPKNKAIKAFIEGLPYDTPIILFWR